MSLARHRPAGLSYPPDPPPADWPDDDEANYCADHHGDRVAAITDAIRSNTAPVMAEFCAEALEWPWIEAPELAALIAAVVQPTPETMAAAQALCDRLIQRYAESRADR